MINKTTYNFLKSHSYSDLTKLNHRVFLCNDSTDNLIKNGS